MDGLARDDESHRRRVQLNRDRHKAEYDARLQQGLKRRQIQPLHQPLGTILPLQIQSPLLTKYQSPAVHPNVRRLVNDEQETWRQDLLEPTPPQPGQQRQDTLAPYNYVPGFTAINTLPPIRNMLANTHIPRLAGPRAPPARPPQPTNTTRKSQHGFTGPEDALPVVQGTHDPIFEEEYSSIGSSTAPSDQVNQGGAIQNKGQEEPAGIRGEGASDDRRRWEEDLEAFDPGVTRQASRLYRPPRHATPSLGSRASRTSRKASSRNLSTARANPPPPPPQPTPPPTFDVYLELSVAQLQDQIDARNGLVVPR